MPWAEHRIKPFPSCFNSWEIRFSDRNIRSCFLAVSMFNGALICFPEHVALSFFVYICHYCYLYMNSTNTCSLIISGAIWVFSTMDWTYLYFDHSRKICWFLKETKVAISTRQWVCIKLVLLAVNLRYWKKWSGPLIVYRLSSAVCYCFCFALYSNWFTFKFNWTLFIFTIFVFLIFCRN